MIRNIYQNPVVRLFLFTLALISFVILISI